MEGTALGTLFTQDLLYSSQLHTEVGTIVRYLVRHEWQGDKGIGVRPRDQPKNTTMVVEFWVHACALSKELYSS